MMNSPIVQGNAKWCAGEATKLLEAMGNRWTEWLATFGGMNRIVIAPVPRLGKLDTELIGLPALTCSAKKRGRMSQMLFLGTWVERGKLKVVTLPVHGESEDKPTAFLVKLLPTVATENDTLQPWPHLRRLQLHAYGRIFSRNP